MRGPVKSVFADMEIHVAARIRECLDASSRNSTDPKPGKKNGKNRKRRNKNAREEKYKYFWSIEGPNSADLSARNQPGICFNKLHLSKRTCIFDVRRGKV